MGKFILYTTFFVGALFFSCSNCNGVTVVDRPNIVFLFADDWGKYASIYKNIDGENSINSVIETPHIDSIGRQGIVYTNAHVPAPSCTPCRSSILSGQYFYRTGMGAILHGAEWDDSIPSYPLILKENGYHIGYTYKVWSPGTPADAPYGGERFKYESAGKEFNHFSQFVSKSDDTNRAKSELLNEVKENFLSFLNDNKDDNDDAFEKAEEAQQALEERINAGRRS